MTTTHYLLIGLGVALVAGLLLYNYFQERRFRKQADRMFSHGRGDVLLGDTDLGDELHDGRIEPRIDLEADGAGMAPMAGAVVQSLDRLPPQESPALAEEVAKPVVSRPSAEPQRVVQPRVPPEGLRTQTAPVDQDEMAGASPASASALPQSPLDNALEYIARLRFTEPVRLSFSRLMDGLRRLGKPVRAYGLRQDGVWEVVGPNPAAAYSAVEFAVQLADRTGPVSDSLLDAFCRLLYQFATEQGGAVSCPERKVAVERARDLDRFSVEVDVLIGINIVARDGQSLLGEEIDAVAQEAGMVLGAEGTYVLHDARGQLMFSLANQEERPFPPGGVGLTTHGLSLLFDVPRIAQGLGVFDRMTELGFQLAERLKGKVVDDTGRAVTEDTLMKDRQRLGNFYARMEAHGIPAGSERALRLFR
jgi:hypothetical protein